MGEREGVGERGLVRDSLFPFALLFPPPPPLLFAPATQDKTVENQNGKVVNFHSLNSDAVPSLQFPPNFFNFPGGHSKEVWVELCRRDLQTPTLVNTKIAHFATLFKTGDTHSLKGFQSKKTPCSRRLMVKLYTLKTQDLENHTLFSGT